MVSPDIFTSVIDSYLPEPQASLMNGILFGINIKVSQDFYTQLKIVGLLHIVVLSGMNITMLGSIVGGLTKGMHKNISAIISIIVIIVFILFVGPDPPIVRAGIMGVLTLTAVIFDRRTLALYSLFLSGLLIALFAFHWLGTISFQLSFGASLGIILFSRTDNTRSENILDNVSTNIKNDLRTTLSAQVFTVPIIFFYFKQISLIAPLANVLVTFLIAPLMVFGFLAALFGKLHWVLGVIPALISHGILTYMTITIKVLSSLPFIFIEL